jgi:hypothetical protein
MGQKLPHRTQPLPNGHQLEVLELNFNYRVAGIGYQVPGFGFRVSGFGFRVSGFGFQVSGAKP